MAKREAWTIEETAHHLGIGRSGIYVLVARGLLTRYKAAYGKGRGGLRVFFNSDEVRALKEKRRTVLETEPSDK